MGVWCERVLAMLFLHALVCWYRVRMRMCGGKLKQANLRFVEAVFQNDLGLGLLGDLGTSLVPRHANRACTSAPPQDYRKDLLVPHYL